MSSIDATVRADEITEAPERSALLLWMIFTGLSVFAAVLLWQYGLIHLMVTSDRTYISSVIAALYLVSCAHCFLRTRAIAREVEVSRRCRTILAAPNGASVLDPETLGRSARSCARIDHTACHHGNRRRRSLDRRRSDLVAIQCRNRIHSTARTAHAAQGRAVEPRRRRKAGKGA